MTYSCTESFWSLCLPLNGRAMSLDVYKIPHVLAAIRGILIGGGGHNSTLGLNSAHLTKQ